MEGLRELNWCRGEALHSISQTVFILCFQDSRDGPSGDPEANGKFPSLCLKQSTRLCPVTCIGIVFKVSPTKKVELSEAEKRS